MTPSTESFLSGLMRFCFGFLLGASWALDRVTYLKKRARAKDREGK